METYLSIIENNLNHSAIYIVAVTIAISLLICLLAVMGSRRKALKQIAALEKAQAMHEQAQAQLSEDLQATQEQLQHLKNELAIKDSHITQLEQEKQAAQRQAERATILEEEISQHRHKLAEMLDTLAKDFTLEAAVYDSADAEQENLLWQRHDAALAQLGQRLQAEEQRRKTLELTQQAAQTQLTEKETSLQELRQALDAQIVQFANLKKDFTEQQTLMQAQLDGSEAELAKLQAKNRSNKAAISKLETGRMQVFNDLNLAAQKIRRLEMALTDKTNTIGPIKQEPIAEQHTVPDTIAPNPEPLGIQTDSPAGQAPEHDDPPVTAESPVADAPEPQHEAPPTGQATAEAAQRFNKLLGVIGLGKQQAAKADDEPVTAEAPQDTTVGQPSGQNDGSAPANPISGQLKGWFEKVTAFSKK